MMRDLKNADTIVKIIKNKPEEKPLTLAELFDTIVNNLSQGKKSHFEEGQFKIIDSYVDEEIKEARIIKVNKFDFRCEGWVDKINEGLSKIPNNCVKLEASDVNDPRIRTKGQGCYFIYYENDVFKKTGILCWALNMISLFDESSVLFEK